MLFLPISICNVTITTKFYEKIKTKVYMFLSMSNQLGIDEFCTKRESIQVIVIIC